MKYFFLQLSSVLFQKTELFVYIYDYCLNQDYPCIIDYWHSNCHNK